MLNLTRRQALRLVGAGLGASAACGIAPRPLLAQARTRLLIGTAGKGGIFYPLGTAMAGILSRYASDLDAVAPETSGTVENMKLLQQGKIELALAQADLAWIAGQGRLSGVPRKVAVRNLLSTHAKYLHIVTLADRGIETIADLKGKRLSTGLPGSETDLKTLRVLEAHGVTPFVLRARLQLDELDAAAALKNGRLDAFAVDCALPSAVVRDLATTPGLTVRLISTGDAVPKITERHGPFYFVAAIPKETYHLDQDIPAATAETLFVAHELMAEPLAYQITKVLLERTQELASASSAAREISPLTAVRGSPVPFHPGALRYYREAGIAVPQS